MSVFYNSEPPRTAWPLSQPAQYLLAEGEVGIYFPNVHMIMIISFLGGINWEKADKTEQKQVRRIIICLEGYLDSRCLKMTQV